MQKFKGFWVRMGKEDSNSTRLGVVSYLPLLRVRGEGVEGERSHEERKNQMWVGTCANIRIRVRAHTYVCERERVRVHYDGEKRGLHPIPKGYSWFINFEL